MAAKPSPSRQVSKCYGCSQCSRQFARRQDLTRHISRCNLHHQKLLPATKPRGSDGDLASRPNSKPRKRLALTSSISRHCALCCRRFRTTYDLRRHLAAHASRKKTYHCGHCRRVFLSYPALENHMLSDHSTQVNLDCPICGKDCRNQPAFRKHLLKHSTERPFYCKQCATTFKCAQNLRAHQLRRHSRGGGTQPQFICDRCGTGFAVWHTFADHARLDHCTGNNTNSCSLCGQKFWQVAELRWHVVREHPDECRQRLANQQAPRNYACSYCDRVAYPGALDLLRHIRSAHLKQPARGDSMRPFHRLQCPASFLRRRTMMTKEALQRSFQCAVCCLRVKHRSILRKHLERHGPKKFACRLCAWTFTVAVGLRRHEVKHSAERPFKCTICPRAFKRRFKQKEHEQRHAKAALKPSKPGRGGDLRLLDTPLHAIAEFACHVCNAGFGSEAHLDDHLILHSSQPSSQTSATSRRLPAGASRGKRTKRRLQTEAPPAQPGRNPPRFDKASSLRGLDSRQGKSNVVRQKWQAPLIQKHSGSLGGMLHPAESTTSAFNLQPMLDGQPQKQHTVSPERHSRESFRRSCSQRSRSSRVVKSSKQRTKAVATPSSPTAVSRH